MSTPNPPPYGPRAEHGPSHQRRRQGPHDGSPQPEDANRPPEADHWPPPYPDPSDTAPLPPYQPPYEQPPYQPPPDQQPPYEPPPANLRYPPPPSGHRPTGPDGPMPGAAARRVNTARLWVGGAATAVVAALASLVCVLLVRGVLHLPVFAPRGQDAWDNLTTAGLALAAAGAGLAATLVMHLLLLAAPQPGTFFAWIISLATIAVMLLAFTTSRQLSVQVASAATYAVVGLTVGFLLSAVGRSAARGPAAADYQA